MQAPRHIGIDLHRNQFTCCVRLENGRNYLTDWKLEDLPRFIKKLRPNDEVAVEVTGNTRLFRDAVAPYVARVVAVDPNQFKVISHSVKKTDPSDTVEAEVVIRVIEFTILVRLVLLAVVVVTITPEAAD